MTTKEIITLQLGHYANFVGAHWWNIQESSFEYGDTNEDVKSEEINHDVLFREGFTKRGEVTFTPRLVLTELKGGLGSLKKDGTLYEDYEMDDEPGTWDGELAVYQQPEEERNEFLKDLDDPPKENKQSHGELNKCNSPRKYNLERDVRVWSDYLRTFYHPKSTIIVNDYHHSCSNDPFDLWVKGTELKLVLEEIEERVRFYAEECDSLQGFHILADSDNGFSGLTSAFLPYLKDEFSSKLLVSFPMHPAKYANDSILKWTKRSLSNSLFLPSMLENSSFVCPLSLDPGDESEKTFPGLIYDINLNYHTSAILASALDTLTLNHRIKSGKGVTLNEFCTQSVTMSKNLMSASLMLPLSIEKECYTSSFWNEFFTKAIPATCITPGIAKNSKIQSECFSHSVTIRGFSNVVKDDGKSKKSFSSRTLTDHLQQHLNLNFRGAKNFAHVRNKEMKTDIPYPKFFRCDKFSLVKTYQNGRLPHGLQSNVINGANPNGFANGHSQLDLPVQSVAVLTALKCSTDSSNIFKSAAACLRNCCSKHSSFHGMEIENLKSEIEYLLTKQDEYELEQACSSNSDSDF